MAGKIHGNFVVLLLSLPPFAIFNLVGSREGKPKENIINTRKISQTLSLGQSKEKYARKKPWNYTLLVRLPSPRKLLITP